MKNGMTMANINLHTSSTEKPQEKTVQAPMLP